ncbi:MAG: helix-turn-helix domain-containing protein [Sphaerochaetaceae bacterium]|nr:helix-turn-helix domain-containing protein [Sphaerochaetaceae bacterium]
MSITISNQTVKDLIAITKEMNQTLEDILVRMNEKEQEEKEKYLSTSQVAGILNLTPSGVRYQIRAGHLKAVQKGKLIKVKESSVNHYISTSQPFGC